MLESIHNDESEKLEHETHQTIVAFTYHVKWAREWTTLLLERLT